MKYVVLLSVCLHALTLHGQWQKFGEFTIYPVQKQVNLFHLKDMNGDNRLDIVSFYNATENRFSILRGKEQGAFDAEQQFSKPVNYHLSDIADLNKDGYNDIVIASYWDNGFRIFWGSITGNYSQSDYFGTPGHGRNIKCVDIDKDGDIDIVFTNSGSGQAISLHVFINKGNGQMEPGRSFLSTLDTSKDIIITDKNNDGLLDVIVASSFPWVLFFFQKPDGSFEPRYWRTTTTAYPKFKDLDHDNREDMILLYPSFENMPGSSDSIIIKRNMGGDKFSESIRVLQVENKRIKPTIICLADINADGEQDIILNHLDSIDEYTDTAYYLLGKGNFAFEDPVSVIMPGKVVKMSLVDINADSYPDWIVSCSNNVIGVALNNRQAGNTPIKRIQIYPNPSTGLVSINGAEGNESYTIRIYNTAGALVKQTNLNMPFGNIDISALSSGLYFVEIKGRKQTLVQKLVKQ